ncbi:hypothetical protein KBD33_02575 [Candidatus Gracilibacteria bacterium]|nr:hypothetical protein [Candidatus Gracilibacteria bacterium]
MKTQKIQENLKKMSIPIFMIIVSLVIIFIISVIFFIREVKDVGRAGIRPHNPITMFSGSHLPPQKLTIDDIDTIDTWMTFAYINYSFDLPPDLLRESLGIENKRYPKISLGSYIRSEKLDKDVTRAKVKDIVRQAYNKNP